jgi:hypothetical protein
LGLTPDHINIKKKDVKIITLTLLMIITSVAVFAQVIVVKQDTIIKKTGEEIFGKVTEVTSSYLVCQVGDSEQVINQVILLQDVFMIKYANGTRELITITKKENTEVPKLSSEEMYAKGISDATMFYKGNGPMWGTLATTLVYPPIGLVEGIISGAIAPKIQNKQAFDVNLMKNQNYVAGYKKQAHKKKVKKVLTGFGIGIAPWIIAFMANSY